MFISQFKQFASSSLLACAAFVCVPLAPTAAQVARPTPVPFKLPARLPDVFALPQPFEVRLGGYLGARVSNNEKNRLLKVDEDDLLDAFERRDVEHQAWQGEHAGKFLHAATLAWAYTGDAALKTKLDRVVARLLRTQESDGYLGTYPKNRRWTSWDVWTHKYDLIGLLTWYQYSGDPEALAACRRIGDLLIATFPAKKSIISAGEHVGMAATSVLEPVVLLYRTTDDARYLGFARYIVRAWDEPGGPKILSTLSAKKPVHQTANGKAYEMLSNLVGLCELARATGDRSLLQPVIFAWRDIVAHQLYISGTTSHHEHFHEAHDLPHTPGSNMGETCVTVTWMQLNLQLLRLTGEARYGHELERSAFNHLAAAQRPDGAQWCYYTPLQGTKPFTAGTNCCLSSGPRGMALLPQMTYLKYRQGAHDGISVNLFETSRLTTRLGGQSVSIEQKSAFPRAGSSVLRLHMKAPATFGVKVRTPRWAQPLRLRIAEDKNTARGTSHGWTTIAPRRWRDGDRIEIIFGLGARVVNGHHTNAGRTALLWGPLVLAYDESRNPGLPSFNAVAVAAPPAGRVPVTLQTATPPLAFKTYLLTSRDAAPRPAVLVPFAEAGRAEGRFAVWLRTPATLTKNPSLLASGQQSRSRQGNIAGDINDGDTGTYVVTYDGNKRNLDWFAITLEKSVTIGRVVFAHGHSFHDGGWFDAGTDSANAFGKPQVQVQRERNGPWQTVGTLDDYPVIAGKDSAALQDGQMFTLRLKQPQTVVAVRVIGKPAAGDAPQQAFASCAELQAMAR